MNSNVGNAALSLLAAAAVMILALLVHNFFVAPKQQKCVDQGGEVVKEGKSWHCETPVKVPAKALLPAEKN